MPQFLANFPVIPVAFAVLALAEWAWRRHRGAEAYDVRAVSGSLGVMAIGFLAKPIGGLAMGAVFVAAASLIPWTWSMGDWRSWAIGFVLVEFSYYWFHRMSHRVRWLWATHAVHHSARQFVLPAAVRLGWTGVISGGWLIYLPLIAAGMPVAMLAALLGVNLLYQYLLHTEVVDRLGLLERVLNTPSHHRAHHSSDADFLDCNFGGTLIVFDRLFGTFRAEPSGGGLRYGLTSPLDSHNPFVIALREWMLIWRELSRARDIRARWSILFGRPGHHQDPA